MQSLLTEPDTKKLKIIRAATVNLFRKPARCQCIILTYEQPKELMQRKSQNHDDGVIIFY